MTKYLFIFIIIFSNSIFSAVTTLKHYGTSQGLTSLSVKVILEDNIGYLWVGTTKGLFKFDGYNFNKINIPLNNDIAVTSLVIDKQNSIWVGTSKNGVYKRTESQWEIVKIPFLNADGKNPLVTSISKTSNAIWIGTTIGLIKYSYTKKEFNLKTGLKGKKITSLSIDNKETLLIGTKNGFYSLDSTTGRIKHHMKLQGDKTLYIHDVVKINNKYWISTSKGLFIYNTITKTYQEPPKELMNTRILKVVKHKNKAWVATIDKGVFYIDELNNIQSSSINRLENNNLSDKYINIIYISRNNTLWVGNFYNGLSKLDLNLINFKYETTSTRSLSCIQSSTTYAILPLGKNEMLLGTSSGLVKYNEKLFKCTLFNTKSNNNYTIYSIMKVEDNFWLSTSKGIKSYNSKTNRIKSLDFKDVIYITHKSQENIYLGTNKGIFKYYKKFSNIKVIKNTENTKAINIASDANNRVIVTYPNGLFYIKNDTLLPFEKINSHLSSAISASYISSTNDIYIGTQGDKVLVFNQNGKLIRIINLKNKFFKQFLLNSITLDKKNSLWLGTNKGLIRFELKTNKLFVFINITGKSNDYYLPNSSYYSGKKIYLGLTNGIISFNPEDIVTNEKPPNIVLTDFTRFGQSIKVGQYKSGFMLEQPINELDELVLTHKDYVIGFEFSALDYADPSRNKYAYKMEGLNPDWTYVNADNRQISYTNLSSGEYTFRVKGSNKDGVWNQQGKSLKIIVKPAPWLSWRAYFLYILFGICTIYWYLKRKNQANLRITTMLKNEVEKQTKELQVQKQTVETLLAKKNELFTNVSHEFRTPLTLILGPVNKLLNSHLPHSDINALKMVNRNANRLLTMIEQILQIAKISDFDKIKFQTINTQKHVRDIVASFTDSAKEKRIELKLNDNNNACIKVSKDALDIILSNLLSNAIKYTPTGGTIKVSAKLVNEKFYLKVKDSGCGLDEKQQKEIFNRFKRLDSHQNIEGIGIGLSVVEELLKVNNASIETTSQLGAGSTFAITFHCSDEEAVKTQANNNSSMLVKQLCHEAKQVQEIGLRSEKVGNKRNETILIIEDNNDMRAHIADSLKQHYYCLLADRGKKGIALAIEHVPDIIICDVMMPEMDGFHVSRILRSDGRTSHIPLMLLTALDSKEGRTRGWREHVDVYLTKPFDVKELLLQLESILVIRNILKEKNSQKVKVGKNTPSTIDLSKKDQDFVNKLNVIIANKYKDSLYQRPQLASDMAVSERQLQRKLKALIDKNPMDLMREYRLQQAAIMLKDGYQVSITSDECGFSSLPHFSKCFKAQFGMSPKVYQTICKKNN